MLFTKDYIDLIADTMANGDPGLGGAADLRVALYSNDVSPDPNRVLADFTLIAGNGLSQKTLGASASSLLWDASNGTWRFVIPEPVGGLNFICTATTDPVTTAFGFILYGLSETNLIAMSKFTSPVVFDHVGKGVLLSADVGGLAGPFVGDDGVYPTPELSASPPVA